jgi:hypothetical protein
MTLKSNTDLLKKVKAEGLELEPPSLGLPVEA